MGVPYSKQIDLAFEQVGPLLRNAKYIFLLVGAYQILKTIAFGILLGLILLALIALLITVNPDLEAERRAIVTPMVRRLTWWTLGGPRTAPSAGRADREPSGYRRGKRESRD